MSSICSDNSSILSKKSDSFKNQNKKSKDSETISDIEYICLSDSEEEYRTESVSNNNSRNALILKPNSMLFPMQSVIRPKYQTNKKIKEISTYCMEPGTQKVFCIS